MDRFFNKQSDYDAGKFQKLEGRREGSHPRFVGAAEWLLPRKFGLRSTLFSPFHWHLFSKHFHTWWARAYLFVGGAVMYKWGTSFMAHKKRKPYVDWNAENLGRLK